VQDAGYAPAVPILDQLLGWVADGNWPVAEPMADFLATVGEPIVPALKKVLEDWWER
jgi:hypothetical protein